MGSKRKVTEQQREKRKQKIILGGKVKNRTKQYRTGPFE